MQTFVTKLPDIELIAGDSGITLEFQVFYEDGEPLDLADDTAKWLLAPIGQRHMPIIEKNGVIQRDAALAGGYLFYRFLVILKTEDTENLYGRYVHQPVLIDRKGQIFRRAEGYITFRPVIKN